MKISYFEDLSNIDNRYCGYFRLDIEDKYMAHTVLFHISGEFSILSDPHDAAHYYYEYPTEQLVEFARKHIAQYDLPKSIFNDSIMDELQEKISATII